MSTAYPPRFVKYMLSSQKERKAAKNAPMTGGSFGSFPSAFGLYYVGPGQDYLSQDFDFSALVNHDDSESTLSSTRRDPMYAITFHKGPGSRQATIYATPEPGVKPMAIATNEKAYASSSDIKLPGAKPGDGPRVEKVKYSGLSSDSYVLSIHRLSLEWREDKTKRPRMRRLYRLRPPSESSEYTKGSKATGEVVATWTEGSIPNKDGQLAFFRFLDPGIAQILGGYGTLFVVAAVLAAIQQGPAIEGESSCSIFLRRRITDCNIGTMTWHEEKKLEKDNYS